MHVSCLISPTGPLLQVNVMVSQARQAALQKAGQPIPPPVLATLLVDTGATCTNLDDKIIAALHLQPTGSVPVHTPSTAGVPVTQKLYDVGIIIMGTSPGGGVGGHVLHNLPVIGCDFSGGGIDGLLGRDVLKQSRMTYSGPDNLMLLSF